MQAETLRKRYDRSGGCVMETILFRVQKQANGAYDLSVSYDGTANSFEMVDQYPSKEAAKLDALRVKREWVKKQEIDKTYEPELFTV